MEQTISNLKSQYAQWRSTKIIKNARIPQDLIDKTIEVNNQFPEAKLKFLLGLSVPTWKKIIFESKNKDNGQGVLPKKNAKKSKKLSSFLKLDPQEPNAQFQVSQNTEIFNDSFEGKSLAMVMRVNNIQIKIFN